MQVVDGVEVHVLSVPGKRGLPHAEVEVGRVDSGNGHAILIHHPIQDGAQTVDIPLLDTGVCQCACENAQTRECTDQRMGVL